MATVPLLEPTPLARVKAFPGKSPRRETEPGPPAGAAAGWHHLASKSARPISIMASFTLEIQLPQGSISLGWIFSAGCHASGACSWHDGLTAAAAAAAGMGW